MSGTAVAILIGAGTVLLGFGLAAGWDFWRARRLSVRRAREVAAAAQHETRTVRASIKTNERVLRDELAQLPDHELHVPLVPFRRAALDLLLAHWPDGLTGTDRNEVAATLSLRDHIIERMRARQSFKEVGWTIVLDPSEVLMLFADSLLDDMACLSERLAELDQRLALLTGDQPRDASDQRDGQRDRAD